MTLAWHFVRRTFCIVLALFILLGPAYRQVFEGRSALMPRWQMFSGKGVGVLAVHFDLVTPEKKRKTVTWGEFSSPIPPGVRRQAPQARSRRDIANEAARICREVGKGHSLYAHARWSIANRTGWRREGGHELDLCNRRARAEYLSEPLHPKRSGERHPPARRNKGVHQ